MVTLVKAYTINEYVGLHDDPKPVNPPNGSIFVELETGDVYFYCVVPEEEGSPYSGVWMPQFSFRGELSNDEPIIPGAPEGDSIDLPGVNPIDLPGDSQSK